MVNQYPGSVWQSLIERANWVAKLHISPQAKFLTRLQGPQFKNAVSTILKQHNAISDGQEYVNQFQLGIDKSLGTLSSKQEFGC